MQASLDAEATVAVVRIVIPSALPSPRHRHRQWPHRSSSISLEFRSHQDGHPGRRHHNRCRWTHGHWGFPGIWDESRTVSIAIGVEVPDVIAQTGIASSMCRPVVIDFIADPLLEFLLIGTTSRGRRWCLGAKSCEECPDSISVSSSSLYHVLVRHGRSSSSMSRHSHPPHCNFCGRDEGNLFVICGFIDPS